MRRTHRRTARRTIEVVIPNTNKPSSESDSYARHWLTSLCAFWLIAFAVVARVPGQGSVSRGHQFRQTCRRRRNGHFGHVAALSVSMRVLPDPGRVSISGGSGAVHTSISFSKNEGNGRAGDGVEDGWKCVASAWNHAYCVLRSLFDQRRDQRHRPPRAEVQQPHCRRHYSKRPLGDLRGRFGWRWTPRPVPVLAPRAGPKPGRAHSGRRCGSGCYGFIWYEL